jgi:hypothetical protein
MRLPSVDFAYGKKNRPQTPVSGILMNDYGRAATEQQLERYARWKEYVSSRPADFLESHRTTWNSNQDD